MKRKLEFEFDLRDVEDQAKLRALNVMAQALENAEQTKAFIQVANAIANGHNINIQPKAPNPMKDAQVGPVEQPAERPKPVVLPSPPPDGDKDKP
jgi:hypothetical protein